MQNPRPLNFDQLGKILENRNSSRGIKPRRAVMVVNYDQHVVLDMLTNDRHELPATEAWELHKRLNSL